MATIVKTDAGTWKALVRKTGWPTNTKTFRTKRDAEDWARRTEDEMVRGVYIQRSGSERLTLEKALERYLAEVTPSAVSLGHDQGYIALSLDTPASEVARWRAALAQLNRDGRYRQLYDHYAH